jgi:hypothetical protein
MGKETKGPKNHCCDVDEGLECSMIFARLGRSLKIKIGAMRWRRAAPPPASQKIYYVIIYIRSSFLAPMR